MDKIYIRDLVVRAVIGAHAQEQRVSQRLSIDFVFSVDVNKAASRDTLSDTHDYFAVYQAISDFIQNTHCRLLETLAHRLTEYLQQQFSFSWMQLSMTKYPKRMSPVTIVLERSA